MNQRSLLDKCDKQEDSSQILKFLFCLGSCFKKGHPKEQKTVADKIKEPSKIREIKRIYTTPTDPFEEETIDKFCHFYFCHLQGVLPKPHTNTFAMPGRPLFLQIKMSNELVYLAAISEVGEISWFKSIQGQVSGFNPAEHTPKEIKQMFDNKEIFPTGDLNRTYYKILLYPYYKDGKIREDDFLDLGLKKDAPLNSKRPVLLDRRFFSSRKTSFEILTKYLFAGEDAIPIGLEFPPHLLKLFQKLEDFYETQKLTLGKMIYTFFNPEEGGSISPIYLQKPLLQQKENQLKEVDFYNTQVINPNLPKKIADKTLLKLPYPYLSGKELF